MNDFSRIQELFSKARTGDEEAFANIYEAFAVPVYRYVLIRTRHKETAEDITQAVFLKAYNSLASYRYAGKSPLAWLFTIARNTIIDHFRKYSKYSIEPDSVLANIGQESRIVDDLSDSQNLDIIKKMLTDLSPEQREVIVLKFLNDLTNSEISSILGKSEESIRQLQSRGIKALKILIKWKKT